MSGAGYKRYKVGALKRKFKTGRANQAPGTFIAKANEAKRAIKSESKPEARPEKVATSGLI